MALLFFDILEDISWICLTVFPSRCPGSACCVRSRLRRTLRSASAAPPEVMAFPSSLAELQALLRLSAQEGIRVRLLGAGTNILAPDGGVRGLVIVTSGALTGLSMPDAAHIEAMSGVTMARLACFARDNGLTGLEFAHGIPGTVGGGVYMNAGAYGGEIRAVCRWSQEMLPDGTLVRREGVSQGFGYRTSVFQHTDGVIVRACFALQPGDPGIIPRDDARADDAPHRLAAAGPAFGRERLQAPAGRAMPPRSSSLPG